MAGLSKADMSKNQQDIEDYMSKIFINTCLGEKHNEALIKRIKRIFL